MHLLKKLYCIFNNSYFYVPLILMAIFTKNKFLTIFSQLGSNFSDEINWGDKCYSQGVLAHPTEQKALIYVLNFQTRYFYT